MDILGSYDVIVIGAGHAGIEAAHAAAALGCETALFTLSLDAIGNLPCNPSIGGTAKGHLVREVDALGGVMGIAADATFLQSRMLNMGKGPAVHSLRVQTDRAQYHIYMKHLLEKTPHLAVKQAEITQILVKNGAVEGIITGLDACYLAREIIIASGTYLGGRIYVGEATAQSGPDGQHAALALSDSLRAAGLPLRRFKTGTPARVHRRSIDFDRLIRQPGDDVIQPFSFLTKAELHNRVDCYIAYTNEDTHAVIRRNLSRSPLYGGKIEGIGPRYCPSIEDKVVRFAEKSRHQIFVEPCGMDTEEMYLQGMSSSLPEAVQNEMYHTVVGFEHLEIMRPAYAIEYDCIDPTALAPTLECKAVRGLFGAGQFNGTSGYEEAAAQGLLAGINAARQAQGLAGIVLPRQESYIGTLVDDLVTKGALDPYRMMTSRSEYRLYLRQDNADERLTPLGREIGLVDDARWADFCARRAAKQAARAALEQRVVRPAEANPVLEALGEQPLTSGAAAAELLRRPAVHFADVQRMLGAAETAAGTDAPSGMGVPSGADALRGMTAPEETGASRGTTASQKAAVSRETAAPGKTATPQVTAAPGVTAAPRGTDALRGAGAPQGTVAPLGADALQGTDALRGVVAPRETIVPQKTPAPTDADTSLRVRALPGADALAFSPFIAYCIEVEVKYEGYIKRQRAQIREVQRQEETQIPPQFDYAPLHGLSLEAREKLARIRPRSLGQAGRIPGVGPADIACLAVALAKERRAARQESGADGTGDAGSGESGQSNPDSDAPAQGDPDPGSCSRKDADRNACGESSADRNACGENSADQTPDPTKSTSEQEQPHA